MNKTVLILLTLCVPIYPTQKPETGIELVDIDLISEQNKLIDNDDHQENHQIHTEKTTRKLKVKITVLASLRDFLSGGAALIWRLVKK